MILLDRNIWFPVMSNENPFFQNLHNDPKAKPVFRRFHDWVSPVIVDFGLIKSVAFSVEPHFSHWSHGFFVATFWASSHYKTIC
jgi:hypothetical protein